MYPKQNENRVNIPYVKSIFFWIYTWKPPQQYTLSTLGWLINRNDFAQVIWQAYLQTTWMFVIAAGCLKMYTTDIM